MFTNSVYKKYLRIKNRLYTSSTRYIYLCQLYSAICLIIKEEI